MNHNIDRRPVNQQLPNRHARPVGEHTGRYVHRRQLLEEQLGRIRNMNLRDPMLVIAQPALEKTLLQFAA